MRVSQVSNSTTAGTSGDKVQFVDVFSGDTIDATITSDGVGTVSFGGKVYDVKYNGTSSDSPNWVTLNYPDSTGTGAAVAFPTIQTKGGAKLAFYEPLLNISLNDWDGDVGTNALTSIRIPDGDGYTDISFANLAADVDGTNPGVNITFGSTTTKLNLSVSTIGSVSGAIGSLTFNITSAGSINRNATNLYLKNPDAAGNILTPAIIVFEEKDDNSLYQALVVTTESGGDSNDGIGVNDVIRTWQADGTWDAIALASNSKIEKEADLFGTIATVDKGDSDQYKATISYPSEQVYALAYFAEVAAAITTSGGSGAGSATALGSVAVTDAEVGSVSGKNLVVVGGSCVNTVAAQLLGFSGKTCGADFTAKTGVGAGQFLIETFSRTGGKVATLVAGYNAGDTTNAAKYLTTQLGKVDTMVGKKYKGSSSTTAELVTTTVSA